MGGCCWIGLCCPPEEQARQLADKFGGDEAPLLALLGDFRLVPRDVDPELNEMLDRELKTYLRNKGLPLTET